MTAKTATIGGLLGAAESLSASGWVFLAGAGYGPPSLLLDAAAVMSLDSAFTRLDSARLVASLQPPPPGIRRAFLLGYEAASCLLPDSRWHPHQSGLGPAGWVRDFVSWITLEDGLLQFHGRGPQLDAARVRLERSTKGPATAPGEKRRPELSTPPGARDRHVQRVNACREQLRQGVLYQANLAHPVTVAEMERPDALAWFADQVGAGEPAYAAVTEEPGWGLMLSLSPECFIRWEMQQQRVDTFPVKGTRPRGGTPEDDARLREELRRSAKDQAEHVMIVDLLRNDLGRVAQVGGVEVVELMRPLTARHVHHLETHLRARVAEGTTLPEILFAMAPGGSITGAPKSTAVEVIHALEEGPRGAYTGNLGLIDADGSGVASILIRTWLRPDQGPGTLHVGGGIVVGSDAEAEWQETLDKAAALGAVRFVAGPSS